MEGNSGNCRINIRVLCLTCVLFLSMFLIQSHAAPTQKVTLLLASPPNVTIGSLSVAEALGFFNQEGIELSIETAQGTGDAAALLAAGKADFAETSPDSLMVTVGKGGDELSVFTWMQGELNKLVVLDDSPIRQVSDLKDKVVGVAYLGAANHYVLLRELKLAGVSEDTVKIVPLGLLAGQVTPLLERKVDALMASSMGTLLYLSQARGVKIRLIPMQGKPVPTFIIATTHAILNTQRDLAIKFGRAMAKGIVYFNANSSAAVDTIAKVRAEIVTDLNLARAQAQYVATNNLLVLEENKKNRIGWHDPEIWSYAQQLYQSLGIIPKNVDAKNCYTNDLLGGMNDFDRLTVEQMAHPSAAQSETRSSNAGLEMLALAAFALVVLAITALVVHKRRRRASS